MHKKALGYKNDFLRNILINLLLKYVKLYSVVFSCMLYVIKMLKLECVCVHACMSFCYRFLSFLCFFFIFFLLCDILFGMWFCTNGKPFLVTFTYHFENEAEVKAFTAH